MDRLGYSRKEHLLLALAVALGLCAAAAGLTGHTAWSVVSLAGLMLLGVALGLSVRRKLRQQEEELRQVGTLNSARVHDIVREVGATEQILRQVEPRAPLPPTGMWALDASAVLELVTLVQREQISLVVETGSGTSTVYLAYAVAQHGGRVVSLEHSEVYAARTRDMLARHGLTEVAEVRVAPLRPLDLLGHLTPWYDPAAVANLHDIGLLLVDGPPETAGAFARYPALPVLGPRLVPGAHIALDDVHRPSEQDILSRWLIERPGLHNIPVASPVMALLRAP